MVAELTDLEKDLEKLKQDVENIKSYLEKDVGKLSEIYRDMGGLNWDTCREFLRLYNSIKYATFDELISDPASDIIFDSFMIDYNTNGMKNLEKNIYREKAREDRETDIMSQEDIPVKKGGKTRKNRKPIK